MQTPVEKIREAILHHDPKVREAAVYYFAGSYSSDASIMPLAIQAITQYGRDAFVTFSFLRNLVQTPETVAWLIEEIERLMPSDDEHDIRYAEGLVAGLGQADLALLELQQSRILAMRNLDDLARVGISDRIFLSSLSPRALWGELIEWCETEDNAQALDDDLETSEEDYQFACSVVEALSRYPDQCAGCVLEVLQNPEEHGDWYEQLTVQLAGEMKLESAIPFLVDRLEECGTWLYEEARWALAKIGGDTIVKEIAKRYPNDGPEFRLSAASLLEDIHTELSVKTCLDFLEREADEVIRGVLLQSVLMNFAEAGIEPGRQYILDMPKTPDVLEVRNALFVACKFLGQTFPEYEAWLEDSKGDRAFRKQWFADHPLPIDDWEDSDSDDTDVDEEAFDDEDEPLHDPVVRRSENFGRNYPCPCGSGKQFQECCYRKTSSEETDESHSRVMAQCPSRTLWPRFPIGTVALYGPDDKTTTKIVAGVIEREGAKAIIERWVGTNVKNNPKVKRQIQQFFDRHNVKLFVVSESNMGCPHEEGLDFPIGNDCPFCPYWAGKQGSNRRD